MKTLKIWTDFGLENLSNGNGFVELLVPFRGQTDFETNSDLNALAGRYDELEKYGPRHLELTALEEADVAVFPISYPLDGLSPQMEAAVAEFARKVEKVGKRTLVFTGSDHDIIDFKLPRPIVFHKSLYASRRRPFEFGITEYTEDLVARSGLSEPAWRHKSARPSIGFCGFAPPLGLAWSVPKVKAWMRLLLNYAGQMRRRPSRSAHSYRARALLGLLRQKKVATDFLIRNKFAFAGIYGQLQPGGTPEAAEVMRAEYIDNILRNDYNLCVRGIANDSIRLFETLCCGRVPVLVNTDCVLPYDANIDWKKHVVWVEERDIDKIAEIVAVFHEKLSEQEFIELQKSNRELWKEYLSPLGFIKNIHLCVEQANEAENSKP